jgi:hypothetical protein
MRYVCDRDGKRLYGDKSLEAARCLPAVHSIFPDAKYIVLVRHVMDTVASGLEASPWGFSAFGYLPFVAESPGNTVYALARYWHMQMSLMARWEKDHPDCCYRVRYEDLVADPEGVVAGLFRFLEVRPHALAMREVLDPSNLTAGPGDYKLLYTRSVSPASVGRGRQVPVDFVPGDLRQALNELLDEYGYEPLSDAWNATNVAGATSSVTVGAALREMMASITPGPWPFSTKSIAIAASDDDTLCWIVEPAAGHVRRGHGDVDVVITGTAADLVRMLTGDENIGVLVRRGVVRYVLAQGAVAPNDLARAVVTMVERLGVRAGGEHDCDGAPPASGRRDRQISSG